jgi:type VI protein secretion system component Hcp
VKLLVAGVALFLGLFFSKTALAYDMTASIEGVGNDIPIHSFSWGMAHGGQHPIPMEVSLAKSVDGNSAKLLQIVATQGVLPSVTIKVSSSAAPKTVFLTLKFSNVRLGSIHEAGQANSPQPSPSENLMMRFEKVEFTFQPLGNDGKPAGPPQKWSWDFLQHKNAA